MLTKTAIFILAALIAAQSQSCVHINQFAQGADWSQDWANWQLASNSQTDCSGTQMAGGLCQWGNGATATGYFNNLPRHKHLKIALEFYAVQSWDNEWAYIDIEGTRYWQQQSQWSNSNVGNMCQHNWNDNFYHVEFTIPHTGDDLTIFMSTTINQGACDEAFGFSDFTVTLLQENEECVDICTDARHCHDEATNAEGENQCSDNCDCDGARTCSAYGWCEGTSRTGNECDVTMFSECALRDEFGSESWNSADFNNWDFNAGGDQPTFYCPGADKLMVGGYSNFGQGAEASTTVANIPPHSFLRIQLQMHAVASWDNECFYVDVDGVNVHQSCYSWSNGVQQCGVGWNDNMFNEIDVTVSHSDSQALIKLRTSINQGANDESMGFSDFRVEYLDATEQCSNTCSATDYCYAESGSCSSDCQCEGTRMCDNGQCVGDANNQEACYPEQTVCNEHHSFMQGRFQDSDFDGWTFSNGQSNPTAECGGFQMMGGYGNFGQGVTGKYTRANLPAHTQLRIRFKFYACASWDNEVFYTSLDGSQIYSQQSAWQNSNVGNLCGSSWADNFYDVDITVDHSAQIMTLDMWSTINQGAADEAWGISDLIIDTLTHSECLEAAEFEASCRIVTEFTQGAFSDADLAAWTFNQGSSTPYTDCQGTQMVGGLGQFGQGATGRSTMTGLPDHSQVNLKMQFYAVQSWDNEVFYINVDGQQVYSQQSNWGNSNVGNVCEHNWADNFYDVDLTFNHSGSEITIEFTSTINQGANDEAWAFSDFSIEYLNAAGFCDAYPACDHMCYDHDEWYNINGSHTCADDCECDGNRTCEDGWCYGEARPENHGCPDIHTPTHDVVYDNTGDQQCDHVTFYSECDYAGDVLIIEDEISCLEWQPKSICIPRGKAVQVNDLCDFQGQDAMFTQNISCIEQIEFELLAQLGVTLKSKATSLKGNSKVATNACANQTQLF